MGNASIDQGGSLDQVATVTAAALTSAAFGTTPPVIGVGAAGSNATASRSDHNHAALAGGPLTAVTNIANQQTFTTGGVTYAAPAIGSGHVYRIRAHGNYVAANSATTRNAQLAVYWGSTQLANIVAAAVLPSVAQTTVWEAEFVISGTSTTVVWNTGYFHNQTNSATIQTQVQVTPQSTTVTSGAQTLDLRFSTSASVPGDAWNVRQVTIERLQ